MKYLKNKKYIFIGLAIIFCLTLGLLFIFRNVSPKKQVKSATVAPTSISKITAKYSPTPILTPTPTIKKLSKNLYVIALLGDSMIDTMGENVEYLDAELKEMYPGTQFKLYNYGIGAQNVELGLNRWNSNFSYQTRNYPPITSVNADVIVLGSFSYNPFFPHDKNKHYLLLTQLVQKAKETGVPVYLLAEIAPLYDGFGQGPHGPNMVPDAAHDQANRVLEQLESVAGLAQSQRVHLIDVFSSTQTNGKYGSKFYTNADDGIHASVAGHQLTASKIAATIVLR